MRGEHGGGERGGVDRIRGFRNRVRERVIEGLPPGMELTDEELTYLEEPYVPHPLAGVMAQNKRADSTKKHVWTTGAQKVLGEEK